MLRAGNIPNPLLTGEFEVADRRRSISSDNDECLEEGCRTSPQPIAETHMVSPRPPNIATPTFHSAPHPARSQRSNDEDLAVEMVSELSAIEAAIAQSKVRS
mgnify:CR=1 FL=1